MESDSNVEQPWSFWLHFIRTATVTLFVILVVYVIFG